MRFGRLSTQVQRRSDLICKRKIFWVSLLRDCKICRWRYKLRLWFRSPYSSFFFLKPKSRKKNFLNLFTTDFRVCLDSVSDSPNSVCFQTKSMFHSHTVLSITGTTRNATRSDVVSFFGGSFVSIPGSRAETT